jgi:hypothetical protein
MTLGVAILLLGLAAIAGVWRGIAGVHAEFFKLERQRRLRRLGAIATGVICIVTGTAIGALIAHARLAASGQEQAAENQRLAAQLVSLRLDRDRMRLALARPADPEVAASRAVATTAPVAPTSTPAAAGVIARIGADSAVVRSAPGRERLFALPRGTGIRLLGGEQVSDGRRWREIAVADGRRGWVASSLVEHGS